MASSIEAQFMNIFASEFNNDRLHDRVLVFEIIEEEGSEPDLEQSGGSKEQSEPAFESEACEGSINGGNDDKICEAETSKNSENRSDAGMVDLDDVIGIVDKDKGKSIVLSPCTINNQEKEIQEISEIEVTSSIKERDIDSNVKTKRKNKDKDLENKIKLFVHSSWLGVHSSYFKALFYSGMKETHLKEVVMKIHQSELQAHLTLIEAIYKLDVLNDKECSLVVDVLALADKYDVNLVFKKCKYVLISAFISFEKCEYILKIISDIPDCTDVLDAMEKFLVKEFSPLDKMLLAEKFHTLSKASLKLLLASDKLEVQSENTVFIALMEWIDFHQVEAIHDGRSLVSLVRFELMTVNFMYDIVRHNTMAKELDGFHEFLQNGFAYHALSPSRLNELEIQPVNRCTYNNDEPTLSWVIDQDMQKTLIEDGVIFSSFVWCMGYMLRLRLGYEETTESSYSLFLFVPNLETKGHVKINWRARSDLFAIIDVYSAIATYTCPSKGFGRRKLKSNIAPSIEPNTSRMIDLWVNIN